MQSLKRSKAPVYIECNVDGRIGNCNSYLKRSSRCKSQWESFTASLIYNRGNVFLGGQRRGSNTSRYFQSECRRAAPILILIAVRQTYKFRLHWHARRPRADFERCKCNEHFQNSTLFYLNVR